MAGKKSLVTMFWTSMTIPYLTLVCLLAYLWVGWELKTREAEFRQVRHTFISAQKSAIQTQVSQVIHYINHKKSLAENRVRQAVKSRTQEAWHTAHYIWEQNKASRSPDRIAVMIHDALYSASWDQGKGYYFVEDMAGTELVNRNNPGLEGTNLMAVQDSKGKYIMKDFIRIARSPAGEGFSTYHWNKPDAPGILVPKISYIKYFPPLDWVIGSGKYIADEEEKIKTEILAYLENLKIGKDGYVFAATFDGLSLTGPFKGQNTIDIQDANGVKIVRELIRAARSGGGFVTYVVPGYQGRPQTPKLSYAQAVEDWGWYIGTGRQLDPMEKIIREKVAELQKGTRILVLKTVLGLVICILVSVYLAWLLSRRISHNLSLFIRFFKDSALRHQPLSDDRISFSEFTTLARSANGMLRERNRYEQALARSEKKYRRLFEQSKDAFLIIENGRFVDCNQTAVEMLGFKTKIQVLNAIPSQISPPVQPDGQESFSKAVEMMNRAVQKGSHRFEWHHTRADGGNLPVEVLLTSISTEQGRQIFHTTWRDISDRKKAEALMIQTEKMITVGGLAAGMAHEINNPLAGMIQSAQVIKNRLSKRMPANETAAEEAGFSLAALARYTQKRGIIQFLDTIIDTGNRAAKIVTNMLNFIRKKSGEKTLEQVSRILDQSIELAVNDYSLKKDYDIRKITIEKDYDPNLPPVLCDESNLQQVFYNIISNAVQAMAGQKGSHGHIPRLHLRTRQKGGQAEVTIQDNGPGMTRETSKRIFEPFFTTKPVNQGTGLGLSVSYFIIVEDHGGTLEVSSEPKKGTCFTLGLPLPEPANRTQNTIP